MKEEPEDTLRKLTGWCTEVRAARPPQGSCHTIARPDFSRLQFPKIGRQRGPHKVKSVSKIARVPRIRAFPQKRYKLKNISSLRDLFSPRWDET
jgi:hypothetical protein